MSESNELPAGVDLDVSEDAQANDVAATEEKVEENVKPEQGSELAPDTEAKPEGKSQKEPDKAQEAINKQYRLRRESEEREKALQAQLEEKDRALREAQGVDSEPQIPPLPDQYDENFIELAQQRDAAIQAHAEWRGRQKAYAEQEEAAQREAYIAQQQERAQLYDGYAARVQELGVSSDSMLAASKIVADYGISDELVNVLLADEDGPLITQYLASDLSTLDALVRKDPYEAGKFLERVVRPKASTLRAKPSATPSPPETLGGGGPGENPLGSHEGVVIE